MTLHDEVSRSAPACLHAHQLVALVAALASTSLDEGRESFPPLFRASQWQVEIEDMDWNEELQAFTYQCPCGDLFQITLDELAAGAAPRVADTKIRGPQR